MKAILAVLIAVLVLVPTTASAAPANDDLAGATVLTGTWGVLQADTSGATVESGEAQYCTAAEGGSGQTAWHSFTAPYSGHWTFSTGIREGFNLVQPTPWAVMLALYSGRGSVSDLSFLGCSQYQVAEPNTFGGDVGLGIWLVEGVTYSLQVYGYRPGETGALNLSWEAGSPAPYCTITGTAGNDALRATVHTDHICGLGGNDTIVATKYHELGAYRDLYVGGAGVDTADYADAAGPIEAIYSDPPDHNGDSYVVFTNQSFVGGTYAHHGLSGFEIVKGSAFNDVFDGSPFRDVAYGRGGNDSFRGGQGDDRFYGGNGNDSFDGGRGIDLCRQDAGTGSKVACEKS